MVELLAVDETASKPFETYGSLVEDRSNTAGRRTPPSLRRFAASLRELASQRDVDETLQLAVDLAVELIPGCDHADIMFIRPGGTTTPVSTDPVAVALDQAQAETGEGPCLETSGEQEPVVAQDLLAEPRWPTFGPRAAELGVRAAACYQLFLHRNDGDRFGVLALYGERPGGLDEHAIEFGDVFAALCATVLSGAVAQEGARVALESRDVIGQAKGILMARERLSASDAFDLLRRTSQARNLKLRDLAQQVADTGTMPDA